MKLYLGPIYTMALYAAAQEDQKCSATKLEGIVQYFLKTPQQLSTTSSYPEDTEVGHEHAQEISTYLNFQFDEKNEQNFDIFFIKENEVTKSRGWYPQINQLQLDTLKGFLKERFLIIEEPVLKALGVTKAKPITPQSFFELIMRAFSSQSSSQEIKLKIIIGKNNNICVIGNKNHLEQIRKFLPTGKNYSKTVIENLYLAADREIPEDLKMNSLDQETLSSINQKLHLTCSFQWQEDSKDDITIYAKDKVHDYIHKNYIHRIKLSPQILSFMGIYTQSKEPLAKINGYILSQSVNVPFQYKKNHLIGGTTLGQVDNILPKIRVFSEAESLALLYSTKNYPNHDSITIAKLQALLSETLPTQFKSPFHVTADSNCIYIMGRPLDLPRLSDSAKNHLLKIDMEKTAEFLGVAKTALTTQIIAAYLGDSQLKLFEKTGEIVFFNSSIGSKIKALSQGIDVVSIPFYLCKMLEIEYSDSKTTKPADLIKRMADTVAEESKISVRHSRESEGSVYEFDVQVKSKIKLQKYLKDLEQKYSVKETTELLEKLAIFPQIKFTRYFKDNQAYLVLSPKDKATLLDILQVTPTSEASAALRLAAKANDLEFKITDGLQKACDILHIECYLHHNSNSKQYTLYIDKSKLESFNQVVAQYCKISQMQYQTITASHAQVQIISIQTSQGQHYIISRQDLDSAYKKALPAQYISSKTGKLMRDPVVYGDNRFCDQSELKDSENHFKVSVFNDTIRLYIPLSIKPLQARSLQPDPLPSVASSPVSTFGSSSSSSNSSSSSSSSSSSASLSSASTTSNPLSVNVV